MTTTNTKPDNSIKMYQRCMKNIPFMHQYLGGTEIFNPESSEFKNFLIHSFTHLHSEFHYISFVNNESIDQELIKVAGILQILPSNFCKKGGKLFDNMSEYDVQRFWVKFFSLFSTNEDEKFTVNETFIEDYAKIDFFHSMQKTQQYLNYAFPLVGSKKLKNINLDAEIKMWNEFTLDNLPSNESTNYDSDIKEGNEINLEKLLMDLKHIATMYGGAVESKIEKEPQFKDFLIQFINDAKNALKYKKDFSTINSKLLQNNAYELLLKNDDDSSTNLYFIKKCINFIKVIKLKVV